MSIIWCTYGNNPNKEKGKEGEQVGFFQNKNLSFSHMPTWLEVFPSMFRVKKQVLRRHEFVGSVSCQSPVGCAECRSRKSNCPSCKGKPLYPLSHGWKQHLKRPTGLMICVRCLDKHVLVFKARQKC